MQRRGRNDSCGDSARKGVAGEPTSRGAVAGRQCRQSPGVAMRSMVTVALGVALALAGAGAAKAVAPPPPPPHELAPIVVSGVLPGPKLWKVTRGEHVLWVLGTTTPAPKRMQWVSREAEHVIGQSGTVLLGARASMTADIGLIRGALLLPRALKARN